MRWLFLLLIYASFGLAFAVVFRPETETGVTFWARLLAWPFIAAGWILKWALIGVAGVIGLIILSLMIGRRR